jgi:hypothetical protein
MSIRRPSALKTSTIDAARLRELLETCHEIAKRNGWFLHATAIAVTKHEGEDASVVMCLRTMEVEHMAYLHAGKDLRSCLVAAKLLADGTMMVNASVKVMEGISKGESVGSMSDVDAMLNDLLDDED